MLGLNQVAASTWGATFRHSRQIYNSVIRPTIGFGASVWYTPSEKPGKAKGIAVKLAKHQNIGLRRVAGAYKATAIDVLKVETHYPSLHIYLDRLVVRTIIRLKDARHKPVVEVVRACIRRKTIGRKTPTLKPTSTVSKEV